MAIYLDSADPADAQRASELGFVYGITTNPALFAKAEFADPKESMKTLAEWMQGPVFYQLRTQEIENMRAEANEYLALAPNLGIKIMCSLPGLKVAAEISPERLVAVTGVFTPAQVYLASQAGAQFVIPYVNRITRFIGDGPSVVGQMADVLFNTPCEILAASIKSPEEAIETLLAGAHHVSVPLRIIERMAQSELTDQAKEAFDQATS